MCIEDRQPSVPVELDDVKGWSDVSDVLLHRPNTNQLVNPRSKKKNMIAPARDHRIDQLQCKDEVEFVV